MKNNFTKKNLANLLTPLFVSLGFFIGQNLISNENEIQRNVIDELKEPTQGGEDNPYAAAQFRWEMITGGRKDIDPVQLRKNAINQTIELSQQNTIQKINSISWTAVGPGNIGGRIRSIIINPSNSNEILIGSVSGGVWKTTNGGTSWSPKLDSYDPISIGSMVLVGSSTVYAGTGEGRLVISE